MAALGAALGLWWRSSHTPVVEADILGMAAPPRLVPVDDLPNPHDIHGYAFGLKMFPDEIRARIKEMLDFELPSETKNYRGIKKKPEPDPEVEIADESFAFTVPESHRKAFREAIKAKASEPVGRAVVDGEMYGLPFTVDSPEYFITIPQNEYWAFRHRISFDETTGSCYYTWFGGKPWEL